jgi:predicted Holliday junction resolvase-like endonuclease
MTILYILLGFIAGLICFKLFSKKQDKENKHLKSKLTEIQHSFDLEKENLEIKLKNEFKEQEKNIREDSVKRSKSVMLGKMWEQIVPHYRPDDFNFIPSDARFLGSPVDFVIFKGSSETNIEEVVFLEIKTSKSRLSSQQTKLKKIIDSLKSDKVRWQTINIPIEMEKSDDMN